VAAFRRVVDLLREAGASARVVWAPNVAFPDSAPLRPLYPGDRYVDWVCIDGFNWGTSQPDQRWRSFDQIFRPTYQEVLALAPTAQLMIETGCSEAGGDKAAWLTDALTVQLPDSYPRVEAVVWFDENKETDWRIDSSPAALAAFRRAVRAPTYVERLAP
jgi:beta-mannanase